MSIDTSIKQAHHYLPEDLRCDPRPFWSVRSGQANVYQNRYRIMSGLGMFAFLLRCFRGWPGADLGYAHESQITQPFELYVSVDSHLPKSSAVGAANAVARWVRGQEGRMFLREAPVF